MRKFTRGGGRGVRGQSRYMIEGLEERILLVLEIYGTAGDDSIIISVQDSSIIVNLNGNVTSHPGPADGFVDVLGRAGDDTIWLRNTGTYTFGLYGDGGQGANATGYNDTYTIGNGNLKQDIRRDVQIVEAAFGVADSSVNTIYIDDSTGGGTTYAIGSSFFNITSLSSPMINWILRPDDRITIQGSNGPDFLQVVSLRHNTTIKMGPGNDTVDFGGPDRIIPAILPSNVEIDPGSEDDLLILNDSNPASTRATIRVEQLPIVLGEPPRWRILESIDIVNPFRRLWVYPHMRSADVSQHIQFTGVSCPASFVWVVGTGDGHHTVSIFSDYPQSYADHFTFIPNGRTIHVDLRSPSTSPAQSGQGWRVTENGVESTQGLMSLSKSDWGFVWLTLRGSIHSDTFTIQAVPDKWQITLDGHDGNDVFQMGSNRNIDEVFGSGAISLVGGYPRSEGYDTLILDDRDGAIGDGDGYVIASPHLQKVYGNEFVTFLEIDAIDRIVFYANDDSNLIRLELGGFDSAEIHGGGGNDTFINYNSQHPLSAPNLLTASLAQMTRLIGGPGNDELILDDSSSQTPAFYEMTTVALTRSDQEDMERRVEYESIEHFSLLTTQHSDTIILKSKQPAMALNVNGLGGDDTFIVGGGNIGSSGMHGNATLLGGNGDDAIYFDDRLDSNFGEPDIFTFEFQHVTKDGVMIPFGGFVSQGLYPSAASTGAMAVPYTVRINAIDRPTSIVGTDGFRDTIIDIGNPATYGLGQIFAPIHLHYQQGTAEVNLHDQNATTDRVYEMNSAQMTLPIPVYYTGVNQFNVLAGSGNDLFIIHSLAAGMNVFFRGYAGNDTMQIGNGALSSVLGRVTVHGDVGNDQVIYSSANESTFANAILAAGTYSINGRPQHTYIAVESVRVNLGTGGANVQANGVSVPTTITGGAGPDQLVVGGGGSLASSLGANLTFNGGAGTDSLLLSGEADTGNHSYEFQGNTFRFGTVPVRTVTPQNVESVTLLAGSGDDIITVNGTSIPLRIHAGAGNDTVTVNSSVVPIVINTGPEHGSLTAPHGDALNVGTASGAAATVVLDQHDMVFDLRVLKTGLLRISSGAVLAKSAGGGPFIPAAVFEVAGVIDLAGGALLSRQGGPSLSMFRSMIHNGYNGGTWDGTADERSGAINSSLAAVSAAADGVGYGQGSQIALTTIGPFSIGAGDILARYTLSGDANLDAKIDIADLGILAGHWQGTGKIFTQADFNYDGTVNIADLGMLAGNWQQEVEFATLFASDVRIAEPALPDPELGAGAAPPAKAAPVPHKRSELTVKATSSGRSRAWDFDEPEEDVLPKQPGRTG